MIIHPCDSQAGDLAEIQLQLAEERFLLDTQVEMQRLLNNKGLRYRDLSKRLRVSEARVSQMFGDEANNLTVRTIAKVFHQLDEKPVIMSQSQLDSLLAQAGGKAGCLQAWSFAGELDVIEVDAQTRIVSKEPEKRHAPSVVSSKDWGRAEIAKEARLTRAA